jgi:two-component system LytT family response regulator
MIRGIIVDDELKSRESLKILLEDFCEGVEVVALCQNVDEAIEAIQRLHPDVVFLDIQLQRETGFDLLTRLKHLILTSFLQRPTLNTLLKPLNFQPLTIY